MRVEPLSPDHLDDDQRTLAAEIRRGVTDHLSGFVTEREDGALLGPFAPVLRWPVWGRGLWAQSLSLAESTTLPKPIREIAILVTGTAFRAGYELYAHQRMAAQLGVPAATIATIVAGQRPADLDAATAAAYDLSAALVRGGPVPDTTYNAAREAFGEDGAAELVFLVASYCTVSVVLNGFAVPVPDGEL